MDLKLFDHKGVPLERQHFTWRELVQKPISKLDDDAFTRVRVILMNGIETDAMRFQHGCARRNLELQAAAWPEVRRVEQHQATMVNWLIGADHSPLETTIAYEQVAVEVTASVAQNEPDAYMAQVYRFGLLEDFDHLYRYSALLDRLEGKDANNILQGYTDVVPARPTAGRAPRATGRYPQPVRPGRRAAHEDPRHDDHRRGVPDARLLHEHRADLRRPGRAAAVRRDRLDRGAARHAVRLAHQPAGKLARALAHSTRRWRRTRTTPAWSRRRIRGIRAIWERFLDYELGHFHAVAELMQVDGKRDPEELFGAALDRRIEFKPQRDFYRAVLDTEVDLRAKGPAFVPAALESDATLEYRRHVNSAGSPSTVVSAGYCWAPGTELVRKVANYY